MTILASLIREQLEADKATSAAATQQPLVPSETLTADFLANLNNEIQYMQSVGSQELLDLDRAQRDVEELQTTANALNALQAFVTRDSEHWGLQGMELTQAYTAYGNITRNYSTLVEDIEMPSMESFLEPDAKKAQTAEFKEALSKTIKRVIAAVAKAIEQVMKIGNKLIDKYFTQAGSVERSVAGLKKVLGTIALTKATEVTVPSERFGLLSTQGIVRQNPLIADQALKVEKGLDVANVVGFYEKMLDHIQKGELTEAAAVLEGANATALRQMEIILSADKSLDVPAITKLGLETDFERHLQTPRVGGENVLILSIPSVAKVQAAELRLMRDPYASKPRGSSFIENVTAESILGMLDHSTRLLDGFKSVKKANENLTKEFKTLSKEMAKVNDTEAAVREVEVKELFTRADGMAGTFRFLQNALRTLGTVSVEAATQQTAICAIYTKELKAFADKETAE